jgi:AraC-like DNA-binding protein
MGLLHCRERMLQVREKPRSPKGNFASTLVAVRNNGSVCASLPKGSPPMPRIPLLDALGRLLHPVHSKPLVTVKDRVFLDQFCRIVAEQQSNPKFSTGAAAARIGISRMHLNRKLRALTGQSTHDFILGKRLDAARCLLSGSLPIESIAQSVGFKSSSHFSRVFRERFGTTPSDFRAKESLARQPTSRKT